MIHQSRQRRILRARKERSDFSDRCNNRIILPQQARNWDCDK